MNTLGLLFVFFLVLILSMLSMNPSFDGFPNSRPKGVQLPEPHVRVFYHVFHGGPLSAANEAVVTSIVKEQMLSVQSALPNSFAMDFITVGMPWDIASINASGLNCPTCYHRAHYKEAWEMVTLQFLHEYCTHHPTKQVAYMHSKGSYHQNPANDQFRRFCMKGTMSPECVHMPDACDVCSHRFAPFPHPHTSGNMWQAQCSHIRRLVQPAIFERVMNNFWAAHRQFAPFGTEDWRHGYNRFAAEHWVHSHPDTVPCDVYPGKYAWGYQFPADAIVGTWLPQLQIGMRWPYRQYKGPDSQLTPQAFAKWVQWRCLEWRTVYKKLPTEFRKWRFKEELRDISNLGFDAARCGVT